MRLDKPIGTLLLLWPTLIALLVASNGDVNLRLFVIFSLGALVMRSAGCVINDLIDKDIDAKVDRTKIRPIASGKISVKLGLAYSVILCVVAFCVLLQFNFFTIFSILYSYKIVFSDCVSWMSSSHFTQIIERIHLFPTLSVIEFVV